jgi:hypothetical protein
MVCGRLDAVGWLAAPACAGMALVPHGHAVSASFHDSQAEQADAPDISGVNVTRRADGSVVLRVRVLNRPVHLARPSGAEPGNTVWRVAAVLPPACIRTRRGRGPGRADESREGAVKHPKVTGGCFWWFPCNRRGERRAECCSGPAVPRG